MPRALPAPGKCRENRRFHFVLAGPCESESVHRRPSFSLDVLSTGGRL